MIVWSCLRRFSNTGRKQRLFPHLVKQPPAELRVYPNQYPKEINDTSPSLISKERPVRFVTAKDEVIEKYDSPEHMRAIQSYNPKWKSPPNSYYMDIGVLGPVNSGKSALTGCLAHKISAVSPKAQTTHEVINVIKSYEVSTELGLKNVQLNYHDTPGLVQYRGGFQTKHWNVLGDIDFALVVLDSTKRFEEGVRVAIQRIEARSAKMAQPILKALVLNKIDLMASRNRFNTLISQIEQFGKFDRIFYTSVETGYGIKELENYLISMAPSAEWEYPKEVRTTLTQRQIFEEMMREAVFHRTYEEVPHIMSIQAKSIATKSDGRHYFKFKLGVETENQQRLLIGTKGRNINFIKEQFIKQYCKGKGDKPDVEIQVSIMSKFQRRMDSVEEVISGEKDYIVQAKKELQELNEKFMRKVRGAPLKKPTQN